MPQSLLNRVAVVTGAGSDVGRAIAGRLLAEGAKVVVFSDNRAALQELESRAPARVLAHQGDVTLGGDVRNLLRATLRRFGNADILVPAAGVLRFAPMQETTEAVVSELFARNFTAVVQFVREYLPHLNPAASIIFITAQLRPPAPPGFGLFHAGKAALRTMAAELARELKPRRIRVNSIAPTLTLPPMGRNASNGRSAPKGTTTTAQMRPSTEPTFDTGDSALFVPHPGHSSVAAGQPGDTDPLWADLGADGLLDPEAVADVALFLASDASRHLSGQELAVGEHG